MMKTNNETTVPRNGPTFDPEILIKECTKAKEFAYSPYSKFRVGAALLTDDNQVFTGCNVENASHGLSICAERTAIVKAVSSGSTKYKAIAVTTDMNEYISPCGACRQFIVEFGLDIVVYLVAKDLTYQTTTSGDLLPQAFTPKDLERHAKLNSKTVS
jgi:cytidine deaminase